jgi:hypothetical protein
MNSSREQGAGGDDRLEVLTVRRAIWNHGWRWVVSRRRNTSGAEALEERGFLSQTAAADYIREVEPTLPRMRRPDSGSHGAAGWDAYFREMHNRGLATGLDQLMNHPRWGTPDRPNVNARVGFAFSMPKGWRFREDSEYEEILRVHQWKHDVVRGLHLKESLEPPVVSVRPAGDGLPWLRPGFSVHCSRDHDDPSPEEVIRATLALADQAIFFDLSILEGPVAVEMPGFHSAEARPAWTATVSYTLITSTSAPVRCWSRVYLTRQGPYIVQGQFTTPVHGALGAATAAAHEILGTFRVGNPQARA